MATPKQRTPPMELIRRLADIPDFQSEDEEHAFWTTHEFGAGAPERCPAACPRWSAASAREDQECGRALR